VLVLFAIAIRLVHTLVPQRRTKRLSDDVRAETDSADFMSLKLIIILALFMVARSSASESEDHYNFVDVLGRWT